MRDAEQAERAHLAKIARSVFSCAIGFDHPRHQLVLGVAARGVADQPLVLGELVVEQQRIVPLERRARRRLAMIGHVASSSIFCRGRTITDPRDWANALPANFVFSGAARRHQARASEPAQGPAGKSP